MQEQRDQRHKCSVHPHDNSLGYGINRTGATISIILSRCCLQSFPMTVFTQVALSPVTQQLVPAYIHQAGVPCTLQDEQRLGPRAL